MVNARVEDWIRSEEYDNALSLAHRALTKFPKERQAGLTQKLAGDARRLSEDFDQAILEYEKVVGSRAWKGELVPQALYWMGVCELKRNEPRRAFAYFQRIYVLYTGYPEWTAKGYAGSVECLRQLGKRTGMVRTWYEMLSIPEIASTPEGRDAQRELDALKGY